MLVTSLRRVEMEDRKREGMKEKGNYRRGEAGVGPQKGGLGLAP